MKRGQRRSNNSPYVAKHYLSLLLICAKKLWSKKRRPEIHWDALWLLNLQCCLCSSALSSDFLRNECSAFNLAAAGCKSEKSLERCGREDVQA